jgi:hypothetical protein
MAQGAYNKLSTEDMASPAETEIEMEVGGADEMGDEESLSVDPETGEAEIVIETDAEGAQQIMEALIPHNANLAEHLEESALDELGERLHGYYESDKESRSEWYDTLTTGLRRLGIYKGDDAGDAGVQNVTHPLIIEAATQFQARAMAELFPPGGPVKTRILGESTKDTIAQSRRIEDYMNYQLTVEDRGYYDEQDKKYFRLALSGSEFDKQYYCPSERRVVSRWVKSDDFVMPYTCGGLRHAPRYAHKITYTHAQYRRLVAAGFYKDVCGCEPEDGMVDPTDDLVKSPTSDVVAEITGEQVRHAVDDMDRLHVFAEMHIDLDLPGFEYEYPLPYIVTFDLSTKKVLNVYRNWDEGDDNYKRRVWFTQKDMMPGLGAYGFGLIHCIGGIADAATDILQILIDSGAFSSLSGGFKSKDAKINGEVDFVPGQWKDTEMTADELSRAFFPLPYKEPSNVLLTLLGTLTEFGQRFAATTDTMVGDAANSGPVGTTVALIEQGSKVLSGIHKRLHKALGDELINIAKLNGEYLPEAYPYNVGEGAVLRQDFDGRIDVIPVSDPNIFSSAQRIAMAQTALQLAQSMPDIADRRAAALNLLEAVRFPDPEKVFPKPAEAQRADPISEGVFVFLGRPIKAFLDQDHSAHLAVHQLQLQTMQPPMSNALQAHLQEHMAMMTYMQFAQMGAPLPPINFHAESNEPMLPDLPPMIEVQISQQSAMMAQQIMQQQMQAAQAQQAAQQGQAAQPQVDPVQQAAQQEQLRAQQAQLQEERKNQSFALDQQRKDRALAADIDRKDAMQGLSPQLVKQAEEFITETGVPMSPRELAVLAKALGKPFAEVVQSLSRMMQGGQGGSQFAQTTEFANKEGRYR